MPCQFSLYFTPGEIIIFLNGVFLIVKRFAFYKPHVHGCVTSDTEVCILYSCLTAISKISFELTLFYHTQQYAVMDFDCICLSVYIVNMLPDHILFFFFYLIILWKFWTSSHYIHQLSGGRNPRYSVPIFAAITEHLGLSWINQMRPFPGENSSNLYLGNHNTCSTFFHYSFFCCIVCISASFTRMFTASQFIWISCGVPLFVPLLFPSALPLNFHFIRINRLSLLQCKTSLPSQCHFGHIWWLKHSVSFTETQNRLAGKIWIQIIIHNISLKRK